MILNVTGNRCLEWGRCSPDREKHQERAICCVVNNQMLGFKLWVKGEEEGTLVERGDTLDHLFFRAVTALRKNTITAQLADRRSLSFEE